jgi:hypothetical protein
MLQITLMDPHMWADLNPFIKLTEISNNKPKTKKIIIKYEINILDMLESDLSPLKSLK